jgi:hypothetical protein
MGIKNCITVLCRRWGFDIWPRWRSTYISEEKWSLDFDIAD